MRRYYRKDGFYLERGYKSKEVCGPEQHRNKYAGGIKMVCVGIDVAKDKHDCCILDSDGTIRADCITIPNNMDGFKQLLQTIRDCTKKSDKIKVGLEATGHYSYNILGFLLDNDLAVYVMNQNRSCGCKNDCNYAIVRCRPQVLHGYSIP